VITRIIDRSGVCELLKSLKLVPLMTHPQLSYSPKVNFRAHKSQKIQAHMFISYLLKPNFNILLILTPISYKWSSVIMMVC